MQYQVKGKSIVSLEFFLQYGKETLQNLVNRSVYKIQPEPYYWNLNNGVHAATFPIYTFKTISQVFLLWQVHDILCL